MIHNQPKYPLFTHVGGYVYMCFWAKCVSSDAGNIPNNELQKQTETSLVCSLMERVC